MPRWPKDTQAARDAFYGDPGKGEIASQMVPVVPPFAMYYEGKRVKAIQFHRLAAPYLMAAFNEIWDACGRDQAKIDASGVSNYNGAYNHRLVRGSSTKWSNHAYAAAIDLNAGENALGVKKGTMPQFVVDAFCRQGAMWGGWYTSRPDWMHFEFVDNGGRKPSGPPPVWPPATVGVLSPPADAPADEFERDEPDAPSSTPSTGLPVDKTVISARTAAGTAVGIPIVGKAVESIVGQSSDIADQVTTVADKSGNVIAATKQVVSIPKPGFWNGLLHIITSPGFLLGVIVAVGFAWAFVWFWQRQKAKV